MDKDLKKPLISVIMPVYNCESYIAEAIESILNQTYIYFELIIIDDYSTDSTPDIIVTYNDTRIRFIKKNKNTGLVSSLNMGIDLSKGEYIARMDGDDISNDRRFERQIELMQSNPNIVLCGTWFQIIPSDEIIKHPLKHNDIKKALLDYCALGHPTVMIRKSTLIQEALRYEASVESTEDYELWTKIINKGIVMNIPEVLLKYRRHDEQMSLRIKDLQYGYACLCRIKMLCLPIPEVTQRDIYISRIIINNELVNSNKLLGEILDWLKRLVHANYISCDYENFEEYINLKKSHLFLSFYRNKLSYNPLILIEYILLVIKNRLQIPLKEYSRIFAKCMIFYNKSVIKLNA
jgi:glycosyltransferase involved in cell wall biosynthesis